METQHTRSPSRHRDRQQRDAFSFKACRPRTVMVACRELAVAEALAHYLFATGAAAAPDVVTSVPAALEVAGTRRPEVLLVDTDFLASSGVGWINSLPQQAPRVLVLVQGGHDAQDVAERAKQVGAAGFLSARAPLGQLGEAIDRVMAGQAWPPPSALAG